MNNNNNMRNNVILAALLLVVYSVVIVFLFFALKQVDKMDKTSGIKAEQCQYPNRPLVDGHCDNSDPAVPECIKAPDEHACALQYNRHIDEPKVEMLPSVGGSGK